MADSIGKATVVSVLSNWLALPVGVALNVLMARVLGPDIKGALTVFTTTQGVLLIPGSAIQTSLIHFIAQRRPNWGALRRLINYLAISQAVISTGILAVLVQSPQVRGL